MYAILKRDETVNYPGFILCLIPFFKRPITLELRTIKVSWIRGKLKEENKNSFLAVYLLCFFSIYIMTQTCSVQQRFLLRK